MRAIKVIIFMENLLQRITIDPAKCGGKPSIRGMRIRVQDVLDLLASGLTREEVLQELPDLESDDIKAVLQYASKSVSHELVMV
jgi:uncharacterized protein (DUF433 family)